MMWASLFLAGILSGWWGALALAAAPPANTALTSTIDNRSSGTDISDSNAIHGGITPSKRIESPAMTIMTMMAKSSRTVAGNNLSDIKTAISLPSTTEAIATNGNSNNLKNVYPRVNRNNVQLKYFQRNSQRRWKETTQSIDIGNKEKENDSARDLSINRDKKEQQRKENMNRINRMMVVPPLKNVLGYQVTPISLHGEDSTVQPKQETFGSILEIEQSHALNDNVEDRFEDINELQDYSLDDEKWLRESRKLSSTNAHDRSIYLPLDVATRLSTSDTTSSPPSEYTVALWDGVFGPVLDGFVEHPRVSRSTKQQRAKNRTRSESARQQRRKCRNKGCHSRNWCPGMDIGNRAFLAPTVFEGKARSMSSLRKPGSNYAVTFEVKQVYKSQAGFQPLQKNDSVRLHFRDKAVPGKSTLCNNVANSNSGQPHQEQQRDNTSGVVRANIKRGKVYLVFVNRMGPRNFTILGEPVIRSKKNEQAVQAVIRPDYVREVTLSELRDSVARLRDRVKLVCRTRGSPPPQVHWLKDGLPLHPRRGLRIQHKRRRSKVVISSARQEDSGRYECIAESTAGHRASLAAQLLVAHDTRIQDTTTAAWPRQEQPCPIAGDFCMNGGTCLFFETVGEPACRCAEGFTGLRCETKDVISTGSVYNRHRAPFSCKLGLSTSYYC